MKFKRLLGTKKKGENGTILIIGGSKLYTGAPIFAGKASLRSGADLVIIACPDAAIFPIKSFHEAVVTKIKYNEFLLKKVTACVIGPGLGYEWKNYELELLKIVEYLDKRCIPFIIDADGIRLYKNKMLSGLKNVILTPNKKEKSNLDITEGHICVFKGGNDIVKYKEDNHIIFEPNSIKRCGGQGDILAGVIATAVSLCKEDEILSGVMDACILARKASYMAFEEKGYGLIASDILDFMPKALSEVMKMKD